jgi:hypothetical protein
MAYFGKLGCLMRQTVARSLLQKAGAAGTGSVALPAVFLLQRGMASSKLFIGGEFPLSLSLSLYLSLFDFFLFYCIVASVSVCFDSCLFLFGNLSNEGGEKIFQLTQFIARH